MTTAQTRKSFSFFLALVIFFASFTKIFGQTQTIDLLPYLMPYSSYKINVSSGEVFSNSRTGNETLRCTNEECTNYQKTFLLNNGFSIQGENFWDWNNDGNYDPNTTFQYHYANGSMATWLPSSMSVGNTFSSGPFNIVAYHIEGSMLSAFNSQAVGGTTVEFNYLGPVEFPSGVKIDDVAIFRVTEGPGAGEVFYFAKDVGWIGWGNNLPTSQFIAYTGTKTPKKIKEDPLLYLNCQLASPLTLSSRPAACAMCNRGPTVSDCATTFTAKDKVTILKENVDEECGGNYYVRKDWGGPVTIDPNNVTIPFVGKKDQEDEAKYLADYFEGTDEYYRDYPDGSAYWLDKVNYAGVNRKLTPMEYQNQLKANVLSRVDKKTLTNPVFDYPIRYKERVCWDLPFITDVFLALVKKIPIPGQDLPIIGGIVDLLKAPSQYLADRSHFCVFESATSSAGNCSLIDGVNVYKCVSPRVTCNPYCCDNQAACDETKKTGVFTPSVFLANTTIDLFNNLSKPPFLNISKTKTGPFEAKLSEIKQHQPPKSIDPNYEKTYQNWKDAEGGKWYYLWSAVPFSTREDTIGRVRPDPTRNAEEQGKNFISYFMPTFSKVPHVARLYEQTLNIKKMFTSFTSVLGENTENNEEQESQVLAENTLLAQANNAFSLGLNLNLPQGNTPGTYNLDAYVYLASAPKGCDYLITDNQMHVSYSAGGGCEIVGRGANLDQNPVRINDLGTCNSPSVFMNIGDSYGINVSVDIVHPGGPNCENVNSPIGSSCTMILTANGFTSSCGTPAPPPGPVCGLKNPSAPECNKPAITDPNDNDNLCCQEPIKAELKAVDKVINPDYTPCLEMLEDGSKRFNPDCKSKIDIEVQRQITIKLEQPYLKQIWDTTANSLGGIFNLFRPANYPQFSPLEAKSKDKIKYEYTNRDGQNSASPSEGDFYFPYLGGIQQAKEQTIRSLTPYSQ